VTGADCLLLDGSEMAALSVDQMAWLDLPLVMALTETDEDAAALADRADGYLLPGDDAAAVAAVFAGLGRDPAAGEVREITDRTASTINALSAEAGRIATALARLAEAQRSAAASDQPVDAALVRRLLKLRRDRERWLPAEIFADPAWDMLLDLTAARLEGKSVPVSSLCIAAAVPTTTALRWIRSLAEAGLFERRTDPSDARRTWISLSDAAAEAMFGWLRAFAASFSPR